MVKTKPFDIAHHLDNPEVIAGYLAEAFATRDSKFSLSAIHDVARAGSIAKIARATGMSRTSLYWKKDASPEFTTVLKVLSTLGVQLEPTAAPRSKKPRARREAAAE